MQRLASYPISAEVVRPHIGKTVIGMTCSGDMFCARIDRIEDGQVHFTHEEPPSAEQATAIRRLPEVRDAKKRRNTKAAQTAKLKAFSPYFGYRAGLSFAIPLILLAALFAFP